MNIRKTRGIISTILIATALVTFSTGAVLFFVEYGVWMGIPRLTIKNIHAAAALVMGMVIVVHLILNRKIYKAEMKELGGRSKCSVKEECDRDYNSHR